MWFPDAVLAAGGLALFIFGFSRLRRMRLLQDTPTSTIRGVAMGTAELVGKAVERTPLLSVLTGTPCVWHRYTVEEERSGSKGEKRWVKVREGVSNDLFYLDDGTGRLAVDPMGAEMNIDNRRRWQDGAGSAFSLAGRRRRYTEWLILPTGKLYLFGYVKSVRDAAADRRERLTAALRELKLDKERMKAFDADGDGVISGQEWEAAVRAVEGHLAEQDLAESRPQAGSDPDALMLCRGPQEKTYVISDTGEKGAVRRYAWSGYLSFSGGAGACLLGAESLLTRFGVIAGGWSIPWREILRYAG
jgi:hypothetical protein